MGRARAGIGFSIFNEIARVRGVDSPKGVPSFRYQFISGEPTGIEFDIQANELFLLLSATTVPITSESLDLRQRTELVSDAVLQGAVRTSAPQRNTNKQPPSRSPTRSGRTDISSQPVCCYLAMKEAPIRTIQQLAGHANVSPTERYMHLAPGVLGTAIDLLDQSVDACSSRHPYVGPRPSRSAVHVGHVEPARIAGTREHARAGRGSSWARPKRQRRAGAHAFDSAASTAARDHELRGSSIVIRT